MRRNRDIPTTPIWYGSLLPKQDRPTYQVSDFQSEFFSFFHGASLNYSYIAADVATTTAIWGYQEIRKRRCYFLDKKKLLERILRTTNISLWQKHKGKTYQKGLWVDGVCCITGERTIWVGCVGEASVVEMRQSGEIRLMGTINQTEKKEGKKLGQDRYKIDIQIAAFPFELGDTFVFTVGKSALFPIERLKEYRKTQETTTEGDGVFVIKHI